MGQGSLAALLFHLRHLFATPLEARWVTRALATTERGARRREKRHSPDANIQFALPLSRGYIFFMNLHNQNAALLCSCCSCSSPVPSGEVNRAD